MIEKLKRPVKIGGTTFREKINELVEAVNVLQAQVAILQEHAHPTAKTPEDKGYIKLDNDSVRKFLKEHPEYNNNGVIEIPKKEPADPYAEQRKWIGKLCRFWDDDNTNSAYGILTSIDTETFKEPQFVCNDEYDYEHCEPVKPDDPIIYKGEKYETLAENTQRDYVATTYMTDGHTKEYYGQNGASIVTDHPLPAGYIITIRETKGGDNE